MKTKKNKQVYCFIILLLSLLNGSVVFAQFKIQHSDKPLVSKRGVCGVFKKIPKICVVPQQARIDSAMRVAAKSPYQLGIGVPIDVNITMENAGKWKETKTHRIWILEIEATEADQILIGFDRMNLPENAELHYYSYDRKSLSKPSISNLNRLYNERGYVGLPALNGNGTISSVIIEYKEPIHPYNPIRQFRINKILFGRFLNKGTSLRNMDNTEGGSCEIDINCPEGVCWHSEGMSIGNIRISASEYGTGVLLNTAANNKKVYLYTARHVVANLSDFNINFSSVNFLFKSDACNSPSNYEEIYYPIKAIRAISTINDFALLELDPDPDPTANDDYKLTYMGWTRDSNAPLTPVTCLHHPDDPTIGGTFPLRISSSQSTIVTNDLIVEFASPIGSIASGRLLCSRS